MTRQHPIRDCLDCGKFAIDCDVEPSMHSAFCHGFERFSAWQARQFAWLENEKRFHLGLMVFCTVVLTGGALAWLSHGF